MLIHTSTLSTKRVTILMSVLRSYAPTPESAMAADKFYNTMVEEGATESEIEKYIIGAIHSFVNHAVTD
jgi:hypothetical protein